MMTTYNVPNNFQAMSFGAHLQRPLRFVARAVVASLIALTLTTTTAYANTAVTLTGTDTLLQQPTELSVFGYEFVSSSDIRLTSLGVLDNASDGLSSPHTISVWDDAGNNLLQILVPAGGGELDNGFRYLDIAPFVLSADTKYVIGVTYFGGNLDEVAVANSSSQYTLDQAISILSGRSRVGSLGFPMDETSDVYLGPNFRFTNVPLPGAVWLMLSGLGLFGVARRKR